jgi:hypothetical protein
MEIPWLIIEEKAIPSIWKWKKQKKRKVNLSSWLSDPGWPIWHKFQLTVPRSINLKVEETTRKFVRTQTIGRYKSHHTISSVRKSISSRLETIRITKINPEEPPLLKCFSPIKENIEEKTKKKSNDSSMKNLNLGHSPYLEYLPSLIDWVRLS